ncbi:MAG TPA: aldehyde dehydrogenase family protein, partial [Candidatus Angelobacter sp.]|nr:aldehyde dehydrogenase family protein [Candidatus Angelobacter sp.]
MLTASRAKVAPGKLLINGQWVEGSGKPFDTVNPATGEGLTQIAEATTKDVDQAVAAARKAFDDIAGPWRKMSASE